MTKNGDIRGRPELLEKARRSMVVQFRCTEAEKRKLDRLAKQSGHKLSDFIREIALSK